MDKGLDENNQDDDFFVDKLFGFCNIFKILSKIDDFELWLGDKKKLDFFFGYQFILKAVYRTIINILAQNDFEFFDLETCITFKRGISLQVRKSPSELPSNCEKSKLIKKLYFQGRKFEKAKSLVELKEVIGNINHQFNKRIRKEIASIKTGPF